MSLVGSLSDLNLFGEVESEEGVRGLLVACEIPEGEAGLLAADAWTVEPFATDTDSCR